MTFMSRISTVKRLGLASRTVVDRVIRSHGYLDVDKIVEELELEGIKVARSTLHRYLVGLRERDALCAQPMEDTVVTIVERSTGLVRVIKTSATAEALVTLIESQTRI